MVQSPVQYATVTEEMIRIITQRVSLRVDGLAVG